MFKMSALTVGLTVIVTSLILSCSGGGSNEPMLKLLKIGDQSITIGDSFNVSVTGKSKIGGSLDFWMTGDIPPKGYSFDRVTDTSYLFVWTPTADQAGVYKISFHVRDVAANEDSQTVTFTVNQTNADITLLSEKKIIRSIEQVKDEGKIEHLLEWQADSVTSLDFNSDLSGVPGAVLEKLDPSGFKVLFKWEVQPDQIVPNKQYFFTIQAYSGDLKSATETIYILIQDCESTPPEATLLTDGETWSEDNVWRLENQNKDYPVRVEIVANSTVIESVKLLYAEIVDNPEYVEVEMTKESEIYTGNIPNQNVPVGGK